MMDKPTTLEEARKIYYGQTYGAKNLKPNYCEGRCAEEVSSHDRAMHRHQCCRKSGYGPAGLYCRQHAEQFEVPGPESEVQTWYRLNNGDYSLFEVSRVEVVRATENTVWLREETFNYAKPQEKTYRTRKEARSGNYSHYVPSLTEVREIFDRRIESQRASLARHERDYAAAIESLTKAEAVQ